MCLLRSSGIIVIVAVVNTMGVYLIHELDRSDESFIQPQSEMSTKWNMVTSVKTILKPSIDEHDVHFGVNLLKSVRFFCYMDRLIDCQLIKM